MATPGARLLLALILVLASLCSETVAAEYATQLPSNLVTQTVYGFLDFTTTIGNTVMVFSPHSAPPPDPPKASKSRGPAPISITSVVETKPMSEVATLKSEIKFTKPVVKSTKQLSSIVRVVSVSLAPSSSANDKHPSKPVTSKVQLVSSHIEPTDHSKKSAHKSVIENEAIAPNRVEVVGSTTSPKSSIVEIYTSEDLDSVPTIENNIGDPEYEFLSREPSELTEETYRFPAPNNRIPNSKYNLKSRSNHEHSNKFRASHVAQQRSDDIHPIHPTGLVTKLGGTVVKDGVTTVHETSVLGTFISGKYAQVLQSTSQIYNGNSNANKPKIAPTHSLRVLKTAAPHIPRKTPQMVESMSAIKSSAPVESEVVDEIYSNSPKQNLVRTSRRPSVTSNTFKNRFRNNRPALLKDDTDHTDASSTSDEITTAAPATSSSYKKNRSSNKPQKSGRFTRPASGSVEVTTVSAVLSEPSTSTAYVNRRNKSNRLKQQNQQLKESNQQQQQQSNSDNGYTRRFKLKIQPSLTEQPESTTSSFYKFKLNRQPGRWQYKTSPKPKVTIRKQISEDSHVEAVTPAYQVDDSHINAESPDTSAAPIADARAGAEPDLDSSGSVNGDVLNDAELDNAINSKKLPIETLKVEISTPTDFKDTYYEIATIKSPYTYQVGSVLNTRYITVTSTFEKTLDPEPTTTSSINGPLTENILATTSHYDGDNNLLDSSIATLPPLVLPSDMETPPLETLTETFGTTETMLKTHILPFIRQDNDNTTSLTLTQTYIITRLVTATKTLPPMDAYHFNPSKALKEFNSKLDEAGSELNLELDFGDDNEHDDDEAVRHELPDDLNLANIGASFDLSKVEKSNSPEGNAQPNKIMTNKVPNEQQVSPTVDKQQPLTSSIDPLMQNLSPEQLALLRFLNPAAAAQLPSVITTSKPIIKLETVYESHTIPVFNGLSTTFSTISRPIATISETEYEIGTSVLPQFPIPPQPINPLFPQPQQFQITTAPIVTQATVTQTQSKILKLTFGAKTAYTTIYSTNVVPTILTTYITQSLPIVQQTAAFPGYFPAPYAQYPFVG